jgi:hypothetical protein
MPLQMSLTPAPQVLDPPCTSSYRARRVLCRLSAKTRRRGGSTTTILRAVARPTFRRFAGGRVGRRFRRPPASGYVSTFHGEGV